MALTAELRSHEVRLVLTRAKTAAWVVPLLLIYLAQCLWFIRTQSLTYDEPVHLAEGLDAWRNGRFEQYNDHPPLVRLLCTLPLIVHGAEVEVTQLPDGFRLRKFQPAPEVATQQARAINVVLGLMLALLFWYSVKKSFSDASAIFGLCLFVFSPGMIAHFSIVTTDGAATLMIFATAWQLIAWRKSQSWGRAVGLGVILGLLLLAKYSTVLMFALALLWMLILHDGRVALNARRWNWAKTAAAVGIATVVVWACYFFHVSHLSIGNGVLTARIPNWHEQIIKPTNLRWNLTLPIPAAEYIQGFRDVARHSSRGQAAFFLGRVSDTGGWRLYHPVAMLLKWPTVVVCLGLLALFLYLRHRPRLSVDGVIMGTFPMLYFLSSIFTRFNLGERHVLPIYVFTLSFVAGLWEKTHAKRAVAVLLATGVIFHALDCLRYAPGYLSYFNASVGPQRTFQLLSGSNTDWGQGLLAVREYERRHPGEPIWLAYFGNVDPQLYGVQARPLAENERVTGTVIVGATNLSGEYLHDPTAYRWLLQYPVAEVLDHSMYVFRVPPP